MNIRNVSLNLADALLRSGLETFHDRERPPGVSEKPGYTITISREVGALGLKTASAIGRRLGWAVCDHGLLNKIAEELGREMRHIDRLRLDERHVSWFEDFVTSLAGGQTLTPTTYLKKLIGVVQGLGKMGKCIIVGRGANFLLPRATTLRVRLVANLSDRIPRMAEILNVSEAEAARHIEATDRERALFVQNHFGKDAADPHEYDLLINTSYVDTEEAADIIVDALHVFEKRGETSPMAAEHVAVQ
jgi:hypothetical protein